MKKVLSENKYWIMLIIIAAVAAAGFSIYKSRSTRLLDKDIYKGFKASIEEITEPEDGGFSDQQELVSFIENWADSLSLEYKEDKSGNIIFDHPAAKRKKNDSPTLVCVSLNYETAADNTNLLASAAAVAASDIESGRRIVAFCNDEKNLGKGYRGLNKKYIKSKSKVIYLDKGTSSYISTGSFRKSYSEIRIPAKCEKNPCDTAVKIRISGITSGIVGPGISKQPDPVLAFSSLLTRLKSKSAIYRVADIEVGDNGSMYPVSLEATIVLNSYASASFTSYIDKRIKAWNKAYSKDFPDIGYSYEVTDDPDSLPEKVFSASASDKLAGALYTVKSGTYRYTESDAIPEGKDAGDVCGINCILDLSASDGSMIISLMSQGSNDTFTDRIIYDNKAAAELYDCKYDIKTTVDAFANDRDALSRTFRKTYSKVNESNTGEADLPYETDNLFTPCSYLAGLNASADIIHVRINKQTAARTANAILCYIKAKGNTSIF